MPFNTTNIPLKWLLLFIFSIIYLIFASIMYFNMPPTQLNTMDQTNINKMPMTWKW